MDIAGNEVAVAAIRPREGCDLEIVAQGPLARVLDLIAAKHAGEIGRMRISFPDRHKPPFRYEGAEISALLAERDRASREQGQKAARGPAQTRAG